MRFNVGMAIYVAMVKNTKRESEDGPGGHISLKKIKMSGFDTRSSETPVSLQRMIIPDFKVVVHALVSKGQINSETQFLQNTDLEFHDIYQSLKFIETECELLDLSNMNLKELPTKAIACMRNLKTLDVSFNPHLVLESRDFEILGKKVEKIIFRGMGKVCLDQLIRLMKMPRLARLDASHNELSEILYNESFDLEIPGAKFRELNLRCCQVDFNNFRMIISKFRHLEILDVSENTKIGSIKPRDAEISFGRLNNTLRDLNMNACNLNSKWIKSICNCKKLERLNISQNGKIGSKEPDSFNFCNLEKSLVELRISDCNISSAWIRKICTFKKLTHLDASWNEEIGEETTSKIDFGNLTNTLVELKLIGCALNSDALSAICKLKKLERLNLSRNSKVGIKLTSITDLDNIANTLVELNLANCGLKFDALAAICALKKLEKLNINGNYALLKVPPCFDFGNLRKTLIELRARDCGLNLNGLRAVCKLERLKLLDIGYNQMLGYSIVSDFDFGNIRSTLVELTLDCCNLSFNGMEAVCTFKKLEKLSLGWNIDIGQGMNADFGFGSIRSTLIALNLMNCGLNLDALSAICKLAKLEKLDITLNRNIGQQMILDFDLKNITSTLIELKAEHCDLGIFGLKAICKFKKLKILSISWNHATGNV